VLDELCSELPELRQAAEPGGTQLTGVIARRMFDAVRPFAAEIFITPMAAVAGAVAEEILAAMISAENLERAYVNNGGDIALHIGRGKDFKIGMIEQPERPSLFGTVRIGEGDLVRGVATSGWRGRSFSFGIADAVTVLAASASAADAAATVIANAVDLPGHPGIQRIPACEIQPDTDLGSRLVTLAVSRLTSTDVNRALDAGVQTGNALLHRGLICAASLCLQGETQVLGTLPGMPGKADMGRLVHA
jgi:ApbE superfamily uncharacterized protein (UPF0280 family)